MRDILEAKSTNKIHYKAESVVHMIIQHRFNTKQTTKAIKCHYVMDKLVIVYIHVYF